MNKFRGLKAWVAIAIFLLFATGNKVVAQTYLVTEFGAVADAVTDNTAAIQKAIDACSVTGGKVIFPGGSFVTGTLMLKSYVTLSLSEKTILLGSTDLKKYPYLESGLNFYGHEWAKQSLIFCRDAVNVSIEGKGVIDGQGGSFKITSDKKPDRYRNRPYLLWFVNCKNVKVEGVSLRNSAFWMQHYLGCQSVFINNINIWNHSNKNNDMLDIDGCKDVTITNIKGDSDDDGLTLKSTSPLITENVTISNCIFSSHCNALKFGTESTGGFRNVTISNCVIKPSKQLTTIYGKAKGNSGLALEMVDGGIMENITINNLAIDGPQVPLFVRLGNRARKFTDTASQPHVGSIRNISISNIIATGADTTGCSIAGLPNNAIENISLSNISIEVNGGGEGVDMFKTVKELETEYPEATMFGKLPAYGFYIRHVHAIKLSNITLKYKSEDPRPGIVTNDVHGFSIDGADIETTAKTKAAIYITGSSSGLITNSAHTFGAKQLVLKDAASAKITITGNEQ